jgi:hypothetical protein
MTNSFTCSVMWRLLVGEAARVSYEIWQNAGADWERVQMTAEEYPRIPRNFLEDERRTMGEQAYQREYGARSATRSPKCSTAICWNRTTSAGCPYRPILVRDVRE